MCAFFACGLAFSQDTAEASFGFQYGRAKVVDDGVKLRQISEPGVLLTLRMVPNTVGIFAHAGLLFPTKVTEGSVSLTYDNYKYILFMNTAVGASFKVPISNEMAVYIDAGMGINDLMYGGSFRDTLDASWTIKLDNLGTTYSGGAVFKNIQMKESYNDLTFGIVGNVALRLNFSSNAFIVLGTAVSYDFWRYRSYEFYADFTSGPTSWGKEALDTFPHDKLTIVNKDDPLNVRATKLTLSSNGEGTRIKQFTFMPSISIGLKF